MSSRSDPGRVYNRRVTRHIERLMPDRVQPGTDYSFEGSTILDRENNPGKPAGGICEIKCYIGSDGQLAVLEKSELRSQGEPIWACWNRVRRTHTVNGAELPPFQYHVQTQIINQGERKRDRTVLSLTGFEEMPVHGGREVQAALLLAENIAVEKAASPVTGSDRCCSLHQLPSLPRVIDNGRFIRLDWREINDLIGPDSEMIAAGASVDTVPDEERDEAAAKGVKIFSDDDSEQLTDEDRKRAKKRRKRAQARVDPAEKYEENPNSLPPGMSPEEAEEKLVEMAEKIYEMRKDS